MSLTLDDLKPGDLLEVASPSPSLQGVTFTYIKPYGEHGVWTSFELEGIHREGWLALKNVVKSFDPMEELIYHHQGVK